MSTIIKTASWFTRLPDDHQRISISRSVPRRGLRLAGFRVYRKLAPGPWFRSVSDEEYIRLYSTEILGPLDPRVVAAELVDMSAGRIPTLLCFEVVGKPGWCHRALVASWLAEALGHDVPEFGFEDLPPHQHPLRPPGR